MNKSKLSQITSLVSTNLRSTNLKMLRNLLLGIFILSALPSLSETSSSPVEGKDYVLLESPSTESSEIVIYCWLGSASCYQVEYALSIWAQDSNLSVRYKPLIKRPHWRLLAKARLVARQLGQEPEFVSAIYQALHREQKSIQDEQSLFAMVEAMGLPASRFSNLFYAPETNQALKVLQEEAEKWPISGVPTIIIKQRWLLDATMHNNSRSIIDTINFLIQQEG